MKYLFFLFVLFQLVSCGNDNTTSKSSNTSNYQSSGLPNYGNQHTDPNYKYEYRTGSSGSYEYNYDVSGFDEDGNPIEGNVDVSKNGGSGYIYDEDGNEKAIDVEWSGYGELQGTDEDGNSVELEVDDN